MNKKHKIIKIVDLAAYSTKGTLMVAFWAKMDCPAMPQKRDGIWQHFYCQGCLHH
jgi:hypothetical protein